MQLLYLLVQAGGLALLGPLFLWALWVHKGRMIEVGQRFGFYSVELRSRLEEKLEPRCWIHAASIGEAHVALALIDALQAIRPDLRFVLSTMTEDGRALVERRGTKNVELIFFPFDFSWCMRRAYRLIQPDLVILVEIELWPNHVWFARDRHIPVVLVNARMPLADFGRYRRLGWFFQAVFEVPDRVCAQTESDAIRLVQLGIVPERIVITGNLKYDVSAALASAERPSRTMVGELLAQTGMIPGTPILVAGSTWPGEEEILFDLLTEINSNGAKPLLVVVPRDISRAPQLVVMARSRRLIALRRSQMSPGGPAASIAVDCLILDTMAELPEFYASATVSFVGRSLTGHGGQNPIEAAAGGSPVVFGPNMENFETVAQELLEAGGAVQVRKAVELKGAIERLLNNPQERGRIAAAAYRVIRANTGAVPRTVAEILRVVPGWETGSVPNCASRVV